MKIGILTYHKSINYGSVLQAYALSSYLQKNNFDVEVIDYEPAKYKDLYSIFDFSAFPRGIKRNISALQIIDVLIRQRVGFSAFRKKYLKLSQRSYNDKSNFEVFNQHYDAVVTGSDQVWNVRAYDCDEVFFLPIEHKKKKLAYAVSINDTDFSEERCNKHLRDSILEFDYISVREKSGADKLSAFLNSQVNVDVALDPTLLLRKDVFDRISSEKLIKGKYIFLYCVNYKESTLQAAIDISKKYNLPIYTLPMLRDVKLLKKLESYGIRVLRKKVSPEDFVSLFKYAEMTISNSFHGTAFSLIFEKQFVSINDSETDGRLKNDERIYNILFSLGLLGRYIQSDAAIDYDMFGQINYEKVSQTRILLATKSTEKFLEILRG